MTTAGEGDVCSSWRTSGHHQSASSMSQAAAERQSRRGDRQGGGWREITCWRHKSPQKGLALGCGVDPRVNAAGSGERVAPGFPRLRLLTVSFVTFPKSQLFIIYTCLLMSEFTTEVIIFPNSAFFFKPLTLILPLEGLCCTVFALFLTWALDHKCSLHVSTHFQPALCWQNLQFYNLTYNTVLHNLATLC